MLRDQMSSTHAFRVQSPVILLEDQNTLKPMLKTSTMVNKAWLRIRGKISTNISSLKNKSKNMRRRIKKNYIFLFKIL